MESRAGRGDQRDIRDENIFRDGEADEQRVYRAGGGQADTGKYDLRAAGEEVPEKDVKQRKENRLKKIKT